MELIFKIATFIILLAISPRLYLKLFKKLPETRLAQPYYHLNNLWSETELENLRNLVKKIGVFHTAAQDDTSQNRQFEIKVKKINGSCPHNYLVPFDEENCVLPGRVDMFKHYALTGII